jgi:hypothetical protein
MEIAQRRVSERSSLPKIENDCVQQSKKAGRLSAARKLTSFDHFIF